MAFTDPFAGIQQLEQFRALRQQNIQQDRQNRLLEQQLRARNALAEQFGPGAADPSGFAVIGQANAQQGFADASQRNAALREQAFELERQDRVRSLLGSAINAVAAARERAQETGDPTILQNTVERIARITGASDDEIAFVQQGLDAGIPAEILREAFLQSPAAPRQGLPANLQDFLTRSQIAADPNADPTIRQAAEISLGLRSRAPQGRFLLVDGVQQFVSVGPAGELVNQQGQPIIQDEQGRLTTGGGMQVNRQPLSTLDSEAAARQRLSEASETGQRTATVTFDRLREGLDAADQSLQSIQSIQNALQQLDEGIITGSLANARLAALRALETLTGIRQDEVGNTEAFLAATGPLVATRIQAFGAGTGLSDADREFAAQIAGRDITLTEGGIRRILALNAATEAAQIERFNEQRDRFVNRNPDLAEIFPRREIPAFAQEVLDRVRARNRAERAGRPLPPLIDNPDRTITFDADDEDSSVLEEFLTRTR